MKKEESMVKHKSADRCQAA